MAYEDFKTWLRAAYRIHKGFMDLVVGFGVVQVGLGIRGPLGIQTLSIRSLLREPEVGLRRAPFKGLPNTP